MGTCRVGNYIGQGRASNPQKPWGGRVPETQRHSATFPGCPGAMGGPAAHASLGKGLRQAMGGIQHPRGQALERNPGMRKGCGSLGSGAAGSGMRQAGGASPGTACPDKLRLGVHEPWRRWKGRRQHGHSPARGLPRPGGKTLLFRVGDRVGKSAGVAPSLAHLTLQSLGSGSMPRGHVSGFWAALEALTVLGLPLAALCMGWVCSWDGRLGTGRLARGVGCSQCPEEETVEG